MRPDVLILNISLIINDTYREWVFRENGIPPLTFKDGSERRSENILKHLIENVHDKPIYVSSFVSSDIYKAYTDKFYLIGLSYKYSEKPFDNLAVLRNNVENKYLLDFMKQNFGYHYAQTAGDQMSVGYLPVFLKLYEHYMQSGELQKAEKTERPCRNSSSESRSIGLDEIFRKIRMAPISSELQQKKPTKNLCRCSPVVGSRHLMSCIAATPKPLLNFFFRMTNNDREKAEDMLHDLFLKIIEHPESFDCTRTFSTWFYTLAGNMIKNEYRTRSVRQEFEQQYQNKHTETNPESDTIDRQLFNNRLQVELNRLDPESELLFNMRFYGRDECKTNCRDSLNVPKGTVKSRAILHHPATGKKNWLSTNPN